MYCDGKKIGSVWLYGSVMVRVYCDGEKIGSVEVSVL